MDPKASTYGESEGAMNPRRRHKSLYAILTAALAVTLLTAQLQAKCTPQVVDILTGVSEITLTVENSGCKNIVGYLIFHPQPSRDPVDRTVYTLGQSYSGATVVANPTSNPLVLEDGPILVVAPDTTYSASEYAIYAYDNKQKYYAFSALSGSVKTQTGGGPQKNWSYRMPYATLAAPSLAPGGEIIGSGNDGVLHSMNPASGVRRYLPGSSAGGLGYIGAPVQSSFPVIPSNYLEPATVTKFGSNCQSGSCDVAFLGAQDGTVWAFNVRSGVKLWQSPRLGDSIQGSPVVQLRAFSSSAFRNRHTDYDLVLVGTRNSDTKNNKVYGLRSDTGAIVWTFDPKNMDQVDSAPAIDYASDSLWVSSMSNGNTQPSIWKLSTLDGSSLINPITLPTANKDVQGSAVLNHNSSAPYLYAVTGGGNLIAINTSTNAVTVSGTNYGAGYVKYPFVLRKGDGSGDEIYFSNNTNVCKASFTYAGSSFVFGWKSTVAPNPSSPIPDRYPTPTAIYVGGSDGNLYKLSVSDGSRMDVRTVNTGRMIGDANIDNVNSKLYVGDSLGHIYSFDLF